MRVAGLRGVSRRRGFVVTTRRDPKQRPAPDLVKRRFVAEGPNQLWVADMTYVPTWAGFIFLAIVLDVGARRHAEQALRESEQRLRLIVDNARLLREILLRQINAAAIAPVFADVAQDIGQLQRATEMVRELDAVVLGQAEHPHRQTPDGARDAIAIKIEGCKIRRTNVLWHVHLHAVDDLICFVPDVAHHAHDARPFRGLQLAAHLLQAWLLGARVLQGIGGAFLFANSTAILTDAFPANQRGTALGINSIAAIAGSFLGLLLGGAIITEVTFSLHGLGLFTVQAINNQDLPEILGVTMLAAFFIVIANLAVDILYAVVDPRVRY